MEADSTCENPNSAAEMVAHGALIALGLPGAALNAAVFVAAIRLAGHLEEPTHFFIASMSLADGILCGNYPLQRLYEMLVVRGRAVFYLVYAPVWLGMSASASSLILLNMDRLIFFHWSLQHRWLFCPRKTLGVVVFLWAVCAAHTAVGLSLLREPPSAPNASRACYNPWTDDPEQDPTWYIAHGLLFGVAPVLTSCVVSAWLLLTNKRRRRNSSAITEGTSAAVYRTGQKLVAGQWKIIRFVIATSVWTGLSLLPLRLYVYLVKWYEMEWNMTVFFGLAYLTYLNPIINPIVTVAFHRKYNRHMKRRLRQVFGISFSFAGQRSGESTVSWFRPQLEISGEYQRVLSGNSSIAELQPKDNSATDHILPITGPSYRSRDCDPHN